MRRDILPLDDRGVQEALDLLLLGLLEELQGVPRNQAHVLDGRRQPPDLGRDGSDAGDGPKPVAERSGKVRKDGGGYVLSKDHHPLDLVPKVCFRPSRFLKPSETLKRPRTPRIGTERPTRARKVRSGRVSRLSQANCPMTGRCPSESRSIDGRQTIFDHPAQPLCGTCSSSTMIIVGSPASREAKGDTRRTGKPIRWATALPLMSRSDFSRTRQILVQKSDLLLHPDSSRS